LIGVRVPPADVAVLDAWIKKRAAGLSRPEAIRRLVELGLKVKK
jgi:Ribbon-helix-helix protein, copG family